MDWLKVLGEETYSYNIYKDDSCILLNGDCKNLIKPIQMPEEIKLIVTDPPYEFQASGGGLFKDSSDMKKIEDLGTDHFNFDQYIPGMLTWMNLFGKVNAYFFCNKDLLDKYLTTARGIKASFDLLVMRKARCRPAHNNHYMPDVEYIVFIKGPGARFNGFLDTWDGMYSKVHDQRVVQENKMHPNQKPIDILKKYIEISSQAGDIVLDPFAGSGQTLLAARQLGRYAIGIEINRQVCDIAITNLSQLSFL